MALGFAIGLAVGLAEGFAIGLAVGFGDGFAAGLGLACGDDCCRFPNPGAPPSIEPRRSVSLLLVLTVLVLIVRRTARG